MAIKNLGHEARSFTGSQAGVITDAVHGKARIIDVTPGRIRSALDEGNIAIVAGFQGVSQDKKDITTLGRGGSDTTAVALAAALEADVCEIYTDVDGVFTADPRIVKTARKIDTVTYEDMLELAASGSKVLLLAVSSTRAATTSPSTSGPRSRRGRAPGSADPQGDHPWSRRSSPASPTTLSEAKITVVGVPDTPARRPRSSEAIADTEINIDMIVQNVSTAATGLTDISFTLPKTEGRKAIDAAGGGRGLGRVRLAAVRRHHRQALARRRGYASQPGCLGEVLRGARARGHEHRADLDLRDPDLGGHPRRRRSTRRSAPCTPPSASTPPSEAVVYGGTGR